MTNIVLKDRLGELQTYEGVEQVKMNTADGGVQIFTAGETEEKTVELDFSAGAMEVTPSEGKLLAKLGIPAPANLTPENIAEGVDIAGIIGTLVGGGGEIKFSQEINFSPTAGGQNTFYHGLGVVPDLVFFTTMSNSTEYYMVNAFGISQALADKLSMDVLNTCQYIQRSKICEHYVSAGIETTNTEAPICKATASSVTFSGVGTNCKGVSKNYYYAYVFGGLT